MMKRVIKTACLILALLLAAIAVAGCVPGITQGTNTTDANGNVALYGEYSKSSERWLACAIKFSGEIPSLTFYGSNISVTSQAANYGQVTVFEASTGNNLTLDTSSEVGLLLVRAGATIKVNNMAGLVKNAQIESGGVAWFDKMPEMLVIRPGGQAYVNGVLYDNTKGTEDMVLPKAPVYSGSGNNSQPVQIGTVTVTCFDHNKGVNTTQSFNSLADALTYANSVGVSVSGSVSVSGITITGTINVNDGNTHTVKFAFTVDSASQLNVVGNGSKISFDSSTLTIDGTLTISDDGKVVMEGNSKLAIDGNVVIGDNGMLTLDNNTVPVGANTMTETGTLTVESGGELVINVEITGNANATTGDASTVTVEDGGTVSGTDANNFFDSNGAPANPDASSGTGGDTYTWSDDADGQGQGTPGWSGTP